MIDNVQPADVAVILGSGVQANGEPMDRLKARLDKGIELYNNKQTKILITSGGIGKEGFDEAKVMTQYLIDHNIPSENIITDSEGSTTENTAKNTVVIIKQHNFHSVIIVSQYFHITRTRLAFNKEGITTVYSTHANYFEIRDVYSIAREFFAYYAYVLK